VIIAWSHDTSCDLLTLTEGTAVGIVDRRRIWVFHWFFRRVAWALDDFSHMLFGHILQETL
jgi:hypothetical protein